LTIGNFDGVHRGHRALLDKGLEVAKAAGTGLVVMTFEPHPSAILTPDRVPPTLTPLHEKLRLITQAGASSIVLVESRREFFQISAEEFIRDIIVDRFHPIAMVEGDNFRFGQHRMGDVEMLQAAGRVNGFDVHVVEPVRVALGGHPDTVISSSLVRHLIGSGNLDRATQCLGRPYALFGTVRRGAGRGRKLGFPTANLAVENQLVPAEGVYAGVAYVSAGEGRGVRDEGRGARGEGGGDDGMGGHEDKETRGQGDKGTQGQGDKGAGGKGDSAMAECAEGGVAHLFRGGGHEDRLAFPAAISIGRTPTFKPQEVLVEAYLLDFQGDLYDRPLKLELLDWIREQQRFPTVEALREQIERDVAHVREILPKP